MVRTLERYINALGGELEVWAKFYNKVVTLTQFSEGKQSEVRPHKETDKFVPRPSEQKGGGKRR